MVLIRIFDWYKARGSQLDGSGQQLTDVPMQEIRDFSYIASVRNLDLSSNQLKEIPEDFAPLFCQIEKMDLSNNILEFIPDNIYLMTKLHTFRCTHNKLHRLPPSFSDLQELTYLDMSYNPVVQCFALTHENEKWTKEDCMTAAVEARRGLFRLLDLPISTSRVAYCLEDCKSDEAVVEVEEPPRRSDSLPTARVPAIQGRLKAASGSTFPQPGESLEPWVLSETDLLENDDVQAQTSAENQSEASVEDPVVESTEESSSAAESEGESSPSTTSAEPDQSNSTPGFPAGYEYFARSSNPSTDGLNGVTDSSSSRWIRATPTQVHIRRSESEVRVVAIRESSLRLIEERLRQHEPFVVLRSIALSLTKWWFIFLEFFFLSSFMLICTVDQAITDAYMDQYSEFLPQSFLKRISFVMHFIQDFTNQIQRDLPLVKNMEEGFWAIDRAILIYFMATVFSFAVELFIRFFR